MTMRPAPDVIADMSMSLDGFVAGPHDDVTRVFSWLARPQPSGPADAHAAEAARREQIGVGALIAGRRLFDIADGWGGRHPVDLPVFVVTHSPPTDWISRYPDAPFTFVTDGVASAVRKAKDVAAGNAVAIASPTIVQQCLDLGLLDVVRVSLVPHLLGDGIRYFDRLTRIPVELGDP